MNIQFSQYLTYTKKLFIWSYVQDMLWIEEVPSER